MGVAWYRFLIIIAPRVTCTSHEIEWYLRLYGVLELAELWGRGLWYVLFLLYLINIKSSSRILECLMFLFKVIVKFS